MFASTEEDAPMHLLMFLQELGQFGAVCYGHAVIQ